MKHRRLRVRRSSRDEPLSTDGEIDQLPDVEDGWRQSDHFECFSFKPRKNFVERRTGASPEILGAGHRTFGRQECNLQQKSRVRQPR